ncbi:unnamed protein product [Choristocarpus tenellus]
MQVSYAEQAVQKGSLAVAVTNSRDTIALCVESSLPAEPDEESDGEENEEIESEFEFYEEGVSNVEEEGRDISTNRGVWGLPVTAGNAAGLKAGGHIGGGVVDDANNQDRKLCEVDEGVYLAFAGLSADGRVLSSKIRHECQSYRYGMGAAPTVEHIAKYVGSLQHRYTRTGGARPHGVSCLIAGFDEDECPRVFLSEPSGAFAEWTASAVGRGSEKALASLEKDLNLESLDSRGTAEAAVRATLTGKATDCQVLLLQRPPSEAAELGDLGDGGTEKRVRVREGKGVMARMLMGSLDGDGKVALAEKVMR